MLKVVFLLCSFLVSLTLTFGQYEEAVLLPKNHSLTLERFIINDTFYCFSTDGSYEKSRSLWKTNGTIEGSSLVFSDLHKYELKVVAATNNAVYYITSNDKKIFRELWMYDGKGNPQRISYVNEHQWLYEFGASNFIAYNNELYYITEKVWDVPALYKYNPTTNKDIKLLTLNGDYGRVELFDVINNKLLIGHDPIPGGLGSMFSSFDIATNTISVINSSSKVKAENGIKYKGNWFFEGIDDRGKELWVTDGTDTGTKLFYEHDTNTYSLHGNTHAVSGLFGGIFLGGDDNLYFIAFDSSELLFRLMYTNGTTINTVSNKGFNIPEYFKTEMPLFLAPYIANNKFYAFNNAAVKGQEQYGKELFELKKDTIVLVKDIRPGIQSFASWVGYHQTVSVTQHFNGYTYFPANDGKHGQELWRTNGATTEMVADIFNGVRWSEVLTMDTLKNHLVLQVRQGKDYKTITIERGHNVEPYASPKSKSNEWFTSMGNEREIFGEYSRPLSIETTKSGDTYLLVRQSGKTIHFYDTTYKIEFENKKHTTLLLKLDKYGSIQWVHGIGDSTKTENYQMLIDADDNITVAGGMEKYFTYANTTENIGAPSFFVAKINTKGDLLWRRFFNSGKVSSLHQLKQNNKGVIYLAGKTLSNTLNWGNANLTLGLTKTFVLSIDSAAQPVNSFAVDYKITKEGFINDLAFSKNDKEIFIGFSEIEKNSIGERNCIGTQSEKLNSIICTSTKGELIWKREFGNDYHSSISALAVAKYNRLFVVGIYSHTLNFGNNISLTSPPSVPRCSSLANYLWIIDAKTGETISVKNNEQGFLYPNELYEKNDKIYWIGSGTSTFEHKRKGYEFPIFLTGAITEIRRLNYAGIIEDKKEIYRQTLSNKLYNPLITFDNSGYAVFTEISEGRVDTFTNNYNHFYSPRTFVTRFKWEDPKESGNISPTTKIESLKLFPNPASDFLDIYWPNGANAPYTISIYTSIGERVRYLGIKGRETLRRIDIPDFKDGLYFVVFDNGETRSTYKIIVQKNSSVR